MRDRTSIILIAFIVMFAMSAGLLATGTVPRVIDIINVANDTKHESINQTDILQKFVKLYLANTLNDTKEAAKAIQSAKESIINQEESLLNQERILSENKDITQDILNISQEHKSVAHDHITLQKRSDDLVEKIDNITQLSFELLERHATNVSETAEEVEEALFNDTH